MNKNQNTKKKRILVVPLNWGLGHATRLIPIIRKLKKMNAEVLLAGSPQHLKLLQKEITQVKTVDLPYLNIRLSGRRSQVISLALQMPLFLIQIIREHIALKKLIHTRSIDIVISDNCYGLWNHSVFSVFITHQLWIKLPKSIRFMEKPLHRFMSSFIRKFNECWVPDIEESGGFAGVLSHHVPINLKVKYLGILSRFTGMKANPQSAHNKDRKKILFLISGPEKQRTVFESIIRSELSQISKKYDYKVIQGLPSKNDLTNDSWLPHADSETMFRLITEADIIICRAGYSSIMDLITLKKTAVLIPTPGQSEQEYLARHLTEKGYFIFQEQGKFRLSNALSEFEKTTIKIPPTSYNEKRLKACLEQFQFK